MRVFISWSGDRSKALAEALRDFVSDVIQAVKPFMSEADIDAGKRWALQLNDELEQTKFSIICLTPENLNNPWILFEAGALAKTVDNTYVCPCLLRLSKSDVDWPLAQFQLCKADKAGIRSIVNSTNKALGSNALPSDRLSKYFEQYYPTLKKRIEAIPKEYESKADTDAHRDDREVLDEILSLVRSNIRPRYRDEWGAEKKRFIADIRMALERFNEEIRQARQLGNPEIVSGAVEFASETLARISARHPTQYILPDEGQRGLANLASYLEKLVSDQFFDDENFAAKVEQFVPEFNMIVESLIEKAST